MKNSKEGITEEQFREIQLEAAHGLLRANLKILKGYSSKSAQDYRKLCKELLKGDLKGLEIEIFYKYIRNVYELSNAIKKYLKGSEK